MDRVRESTSDMTTSVANEASRLETDAFKKLSSKIEHRLYGSGFLAGLAKRR